MRRRLTAVTTAALIAGALCWPVQAQAPAIVGDWSVLAIGNQAVAAETGLTVTFTADGSVSGSTGCNAFSGRYEARGAGVTVLPLRLTQRGCPEAEMQREAAMMRALGTARRVDQRVEGRLALMGDGNAGAELLLGPRAP
jgi:heat shock protein HslJ